MRKLFAHLHFDKVAFLLVAISLVAVIMLADDYGKFPQKLETTVSNALIEVNSPQGKVIIDKNQSRLIFLDRKNEVIKLQDNDGFGENNIRYLAVTVGEDGYYISENLFYDNSRYIKQESVAKYSFQGEYLGKTLEYEYSMGEDRTLTAQFSSISIKDGYGIVTGADTRHHKVNIWKFPLEVKEDCLVKEPFKTLEAPAAGKFLALAYFVLPDEDNIAVVSNKNQIFTVNWQDCDSASPAYSEPIYYDKQVHPRFMIMDWDGNFHIETDCMADGKTFGYSWNLMFYQLAFWLSLLYLIVCFLYFSIRWLYRLCKAQNFALLERISLIFTAIAFCVGITAFYSAHLMSDYKTDMERALCEGVYLMECISPNPLETALQEYNETNTLSDDTNEKISHVLEQASFDMDKMDYDINFALMAYDKERKPFMLQQSAGDILLQVPLRISLSYSDLSEKKDILTMEWGSVWGKYIMSFYPICDKQGEPIGAVSCYIDAYNLDKAVFKQSGELLMILLPVVMLIGFLLMDGKSFIKGLFLFRKKRREGSSNAELYLVRPYTFLLYLTSGALVVLFPVIVREMVADDYSEIRAILVAGAMSVFFLGYMAGIPMMKWLVGHMKLKKALLLCNGIMIAAYILLYYSCLQSNVMLFIGTAFCLNAAAQALDQYISALSYLAKDAEERSGVNRDVSVARISGPSISTFITGALASYLGNAYIQLYGVAAAVLLMLVFCFTVSKDAKLIANDKDNVNAKDNDANGNKNTEVDKAEAPSFWRSLRRVCSNRSLVNLLVFLMFPSLVLMSYKSYIFPLYAYDIGIDKSTISNIIAFTGAMAFYCAPMMNGIEKKLGSRSVIFYANSIIAGTFMLFILDSSLVWAVVTLIITRIAFKAMEPSMFSVWQECTMFSKIDINDAQIVYNTFYNGVKAVRTGVAYAFIQPFGQVLGCFVIGAYNLASTIVYFVVTPRKKNKA